MPDFEPDKAPEYRPPQGAKGMAAIAGNVPFIMKPDGLGWLYAPGAVKDGPLPTHYEPVESPVGNLLYPKQTCSPTVRMFDGPLNQLRAHAGGRVPGGGDHVPAHRALPERPDESLQLVAERTATGNVRRVESGTGGRAGASLTRGGWSWNRRAAGSRPARW